MPAPLNGLVPLAHVADVPRSVEFYRRLGLEPVDSLERDGAQVFAFLESGEAQLMLLVADQPIDPDAQAILFYVYTSDIAGLHAELVDGGLEVGEIDRPEHMPDGEFRVADPDGYVLLIGQRAPTRG